MVRPPKTRLDRMGHPDGFDIMIDAPEAYRKRCGGALTYGLKPGWKVMEFMCQYTLTFDDFREESVKPTN